MAITHDEYFYVVLKANVGAPAVFEGSKEDVVQWTSNRKDLDKYTVWSTTTKKYSGVSEFLQDASEDSDVVSDKTRFAVLSKAHPDQVAYGYGTEREIFMWLSDRRDYLDEYKVYDVNGNSYMDAREFVAVFRSLEFVPKFYRMNPETEVLVPDGHSIRPGMVILIEDADSRVKIKDQMEDWEEYRALAANRWCTVSDIAINGQFIVFTGTYEDGSQRRRSTSVGSAWLVKKDSIEASRDETDKRYTNVFAVIEHALSEIEEAIRRDFTYSPNRIADRASRRILGMLS